MKIKQQLEDFIKNKKAFGYSFFDISSKWHGKGIVMLAGGRVYLTNAFMNIKFIRKNLNCNLPIEIWYLGENEKNKRIFNAIFDLGNVQFKNIHKYQLKFPMSKSKINNVTPVNSPATVEGWRNKIYCIINSKFKEIIYLDSDCFLFESPDMLFETEEYKENKAIFSCDIDVNYKTSGRMADPTNFLLPKLGRFIGRGKWDYSKSNPIWKILGIKEDHLPEFETGFIMVEKSFHLYPLFTTLFLNDNSDFTYQYVYGDKDTFHLAWAKHCAKCFMLRDVSRTNEHIIGNFNKKLLFEHRVYNNKFNPYVSWNEFPNKNQFNNKEIFKQYFLEISKAKLL